MSVVINKTARAITVSHRHNGMVHKLTLNPGINTMSDEDAKLFSSCEYIDAMRKAKKVVVAESMEHVDEDDMPSAAARVDSVKLPPQILAAEKAIKDEKAKLAEREAKLEKGEKALAEKQKSGGK